jgi:hypothetical protein
MAFVNLPPNPQDIFNSITDRVSKLESGPNSAAYAADTAQSTSIYRIKSGYNCIIYC